MNLLYTLCLFFLTAPLSAQGNPQSRLVEDLIYLGTANQETVAEPEFDFIYGHYGLFVGNRVVPEIGLGYRKRFSSRWAFDVVAELHPHWSINHGRLKGAILFFLGSDPQSVLGKAYIGVGPSADLVVLKIEHGLYDSSISYDSGNQSSLFAMLLFASNFSLGYEYQASNGAHRYLQLGVGGPLSAVSLAWGCQV